MRKCLTCCESKPDVEFYTKQNKCKKCHIESSKTYSKKSYQENKEQKKQAVKEYRQKNKDKINKTEKEYYKKNKSRIKQYYIDNKEHILPKIKEYSSQPYIKEKTKEYMHTYQKNRYATDLLFKLSNTLRARINSALKTDSKKSKSFDLLGCSVEEYKIYIEQQFKEGMSWENWGNVWEIDHIKPCSSFDLIDLDHQKQCFNFKNTQVLFKTTEIAQQHGYINEIGNRNKNKSY
jgi:hypothetical protein